MSTDWYYRFRSKLRPELTSLDLDEIVERAPGALGQVDIPTHLMINDDDAPGPVMGPGTRHDAARFAGFAGAMSEAGELRLAIWCQNLERAPGEGAEGLTELGAGTRLDVLLGFLSWASVGPAGEVTGCIASEHTYLGHADPLVRCADGRIRLAETEPRHVEAWLGQDEAPEIADIPPVIPVEFIMPHRGWRTWLDGAGLRRRFLSLDGSLAPRTIEVHAA